MFCFSKKGVASHPPPQNPPMQWKHFLHSTEKLITDELDAGLGTIEGCEHPANWPGGSWLFCEVVGVGAGPGEGALAAELRRLRSSFIVS